jgi:nucleoside-triphosphatase
VARLPRNLHDFNTVKPHLLISAVPGAGKTTVIRRVAEQLAAKSLAGFYTEEIRFRGERRGFRLLSFDGKEAVIAHVDFPKTHRVGKYGVDVAAIDAAVATALAPRRGTTLYLVDEIGKMECLSERFVASMRGLLSGSVPVVATVAKRGAGFIAEVKQRDDCELWTLTRANRDALPFEIINRKH